VLEVGPGTGYYALPVAGWLAPDGRLDVVDLQQEMLDHTSGRAREQGLGNLVPTRADATALPYPDDSFDAAYLVAVLGEIPDQGAALRELRRVVKPSGRIVVGELFGDPHMVTHGALRNRAAASGLQVDHKLGGRLWHFTRLRAA
jgi:ubiquinone/menaquinone biosynthesis C-methylase UbiE